MCSNTVYEITAAEPVRAYDKRKLVPFAEYWPAAMGRRPEWLSTEEVSPGKTPAVFTAGPCRLGILICFEGDQLSLARESVRSNANAPLVLTNDAQLPPEAIAKEIDQARMRAVETGLPVVRAANRGPSVAIDPWGRVLQRRRGGALNVPLPRGVPTSAVWLAPAFLALCWGVTAVAVGFTFCQHFSRRAQ